MPCARDKQKQRLLELEGEVAALSKADKGTRGEREALLQRNAALQAGRLLEPSCVQELCCRMLLFRSILAATVGEKRLIGYGTWLTSCVHPK